MGQNRGNAIEVSAEKYEYRLISAKPDLLYPGRVFRTRIGKSGRGQRRGKSNGISAPDQVEELTEFINAMNGVPATTFVKLAGRAVYRRRCLAALVGGAPAVCTAKYDLRLRHGGEGTILSNTQFLHLIGNDR